LNILDFIPTGSENAISREDLSRLTNLSDRQVRKHIELLKKNNAIINNGNGYFIPSSKDKLEIAEYIAKEKHKAIKILEGLRYTECLYADIERGVC